MKKLDILVILIVGMIEVIIVLFALNVFEYNPKNERFIEIYYKNEIILSAELTEGLEKKYLIKSNNNVFQEIINVDLDYIVPEDLKGYDLVYIYNGGIQVIDADCRDRVVVKMGFTKHSYYPLICLPRNLKISIKENIEDYQIYL